MWKAGCCWICSTLPSQEVHVSCLEIYRHGVVAKLSECFGFQDHPANRTPGSEELVVAAVAALPGRAQPPSSSLCSTSLGRGVKAQDKPPTHLQSRAYTVLLRMGKGIVWFSWVLSG